jgi:hypothetical protein
MIYILKGKIQSKKQFSFRKSIGLVLKSDFQLKDTKCDISIDMKYYNLCYIL